MLKFIVKWLLVRTVLKRFWPLVLAFIIAKKLLPWEKDKDREREPRSWAMS